MLKGFGWLERILGNRDIGPVPITVCVNPDISDEDVEQLRRELESRGVRVGGYVQVMRVVECSAPKRVYEEVFNTRVTTYRPFDDRNYTLEYKDTKTPEVPEDLRTMVASVSIAQKVYAASPD